MTKYKKDKKVKIITDKRCEKLEENIPLKLSAFSFASLFGFDKIDKQLSRASDS